MSTPKTLVNGRYILREKLGQGGMGAVFRADDRLTDMTVALKQVTLPPQQLNSSAQSSPGQSDSFRLGVSARV
jgi:serine/threonine protein kinase